MTNDKSVNQQVAAAHAILQPFSFLGMSLALSANSLQKQYPINALQIGLTGLALTLTASISVVIIQWRIVHNASVKREKELQDEADSAEAYLEELLAARKTAEHAS